MSSYSSSSLPPGVAATDHRQRSGGLVGLDHHLAEAFQALGRPDDPAGLHQVHQPAGMAKPTRSLRCSIDVEPNWRAVHEFDGLQEETSMLVADVGIDVGAFVEPAWRW